MCPTGPEILGPRLEFCLPQSLTEKGQIAGKYEKRIPVFCNSDQQKPKQKNTVNVEQSQRNAKSRIHTAPVSSSVRLQSRENGSPPTRDGGGEGHREHSGRCRARAEHPVSVTVIKSGNTQSQSIHNALSGRRVPCGAQVPARVKRIGRVVKFERTNAGVCK